MKGNRYAGIGVGGSSILVIFVLLCLTAFATLSLTTANADRSLTLRTAQAAQNYYEADARAEEILGEVDYLLVGFRRQAVSQSAYFDLCEQRLPESIAGMNVSRVENNSLRLSYTVPAGDGAELAVVLRVSPGMTGRFELEEWKLVSTGDWQPQADGFTLWDGE